MPPYRSSPVMTSSPGRKQAGDHVECAHARADGQGTPGVHDFGEVTLEMGARGIARSGVIVLAAAISGALLESGRLVDGNARGTMLVLGLGIHELGS